MWNFALIPQPHQGRAAYGTHDGQILVKANEQTGDWQPVEKFTRNLDDEDLTHSYGLWMDAKVEKGHLFWKKTVREKDDKVQPDEVETFAEMEAERHHTYHERDYGDTLKKTWKIDNAQVTGTEKGHPTLSYEWKVVDKTLLHDDW